ncbi:MAG: tetratricopeptide repeat protein, partial [Calditrichia bacterium]|nr:tetratricopeptide repeat protein [Calditrichia bacterium]
KFSSENRSIMEVTTTSLEAYNYFLRGREDFEKGYDADARKFLKKAIDLDSTFAVAYLYLGITYDELQDPRASKAIFEKAKKYSQKAMERDRLLIETYYARYIEDDMDKHLKILKEIVEKYPQEKRAQLHLGLHSRGDKKLEIYNKILDYDPYYGPAMKALAVTYARRGDTKKADEYLKNYASISPGDADPFNTMANIYYNSGRLDEAIVKYNEALAVKPNFGSDWIVAYIYAIQENYSESLQLIDEHITLAPSPGLKALGTNWKGFYNFWLSRYDSIMCNFDAAINLSKTIEDSGNIALLHLLKAWLFYDLGDFETGKTHFKICTDTWISLYPEWVANNRSYRSYFYGLVDVKAGRIDSAQSRLAEMKSFIQNWMPLKKEVIYNFHVLQSEIWLAKDSVDKAIEEYKKVSDVESPGLVSQWLIIHNLSSSDILARAYIQKGDLDKAIAEYEQMITFDPNKGDRRLIHPRYHYRLAKLYEESGQVEKAILRYKRFLEIWKNADDDLPEKIDAQERLATLTSTK